LTIKNRDQTIGPTTLSTIQVIHTTAWYVAHPDVAKKDEARCGNDAGSISEAACQNDASAEDKILETELSNAAAANEAAAKNSNSANQ
jgi:hypothetical protein